MLLQQQHYNSLITKTPLSVYILNILLCYIKYICLVLQYFRMFYESF